MPYIPHYLSLAFICTTLWALFFFFQATGKKWYVVAGLLVWLVGQGGVALSGFYADTLPLPPRFIWLILPANLLIISLFISPAGRRFLDTLRPDRLTLLHVVRIPVEFVLFGLCVYGAVPEIITFEGRNLDILSGISAPAIWYLGYKKKILPVWFLLGWNLLCLALLANVVGHAILSVPYPFQRFGFHQPNVGVLLFPFVWLPGFVVPVVLLSHLVCIRHLLLKKG